MRENTFSPDEKITPEEFAPILYALVKTYGNAEGESLFRGLLMRLKNINTR